MIQKGPASTVADMAGDKAHTVVLQMSIWLAIGYMTLGLVAPALLS